MFCTRCGASLDEGNAFCTKCGAPVEQADARASSSERTEVLRDSVEPAANECEASGNVAGGSKAGKRTALIVSGALVGVAAVVCVCAFLLMPKASEPVVDAPVAEESQQEAPEDEASQGDATAEEESSESQPSIALVNEHTTETESIAGSPAPKFSFRYPDGWMFLGDSVAEPEASSCLAHPDDGVEVFFTQGESSHSILTSNRLVSIEKVADSDFTLKPAKGYDGSLSGKFVVAKIQTQSAPPGSGETQTYDYYALVPQEALDGSSIELTGGVPRFRYTNFVGFGCVVPAEGITEERLNEVIAIIQSLRLVEVPSEDSRVASDSGQVLPDSATHEYTEGELSGLSDYELYIARNEIFARHGRTFTNDDLANHFAQQSWYEPTVSPEAFDEDALNAVEKKNALTIRSVEERCGSAYL